MVPASAENVPSERRDGSRDHNYRNYVQDAAGCCVCNLWDSDFHARHNHLRYSNNVTPITIQDGAIVVRDGAIGTEQACCCDNSCPLGECQITIEFLDENGCEDDVFDLYLKNPTSLVERFIQTVDLKSSPSGGCGDLSKTYANISIPVTVTANDFDANCEVIIGLRFVSPNCCGTWARFRIRRPNGCLVFGQYFSGGGLETTYTWLELCNDDPCPPPPPEPCCSRTHECEDGTYINNCGSDSEQQCCSTNANGNAGAIEQCSGEDPPITVCEPNGIVPANNAPYECINNIFAGGAWVTIQGYSSYLGDGDGFTADELAWYAEIDSVANQAFFVPFTCFGSAQKIFNLGPGQNRDTFNCGPNDWLATVSVNLCARTASLDLTNASCLNFLPGVFIDMQDLSPISVPCNAWQGCNCVAYTDNIPVYEGLSGGGTINVQPS